MLGIEMVDPGGATDHFAARRSDPALARRVQAEALARGLIVEVAGRGDNVVKLLPPLIVSPTQIDTIATLLEQALRAAEQSQ
jgi:diaminobutyrate-2-oxoglutarate transaminase